jgi:hypothetical protein
MEPQGTSRTVTREDVGSLEIAVYVLLLTYSQAQGAIVGKEEELVCPHVFVYMPRKTLY